MHLEQHPGGEVFGDRDLLLAAGEVGAGGVRGAAEGYTAVIQAAFNQASGVQHNDGPIGRATWIRADAVAITGTAESLLHRIAEELRR